MCRWGGRKWGLTREPPVQGRFILVVRNHYTTEAAWVTYVVGVSLFSLCTRYSFSPVTCFCKKAKDWIKWNFATLYPASNYLCTHRVFPKLSKPHLLPYPTHCLCFSKTWGHRSAFQIKKRTIHFPRVLLIYGHLLFSHNEKAAGLSRWAKHCKTLKVWVFQSITEALYKHYINKILCYLLSVLQQLSMYRKYWHF